MQRRQKKCTKKRDTVNLQDCWFASLNLLFFCHSRCRRPHSCLSSRRFTYRDLFNFDQLTGEIVGKKIGILKEGFGLESSEPDVDKMVKEAAGQLSSKCGAVVEEVSVPMHSDGN